MFMFVISTWRMLEGTEYQTLEFQVAESHYLAAGSQPVSSSRAARAVNHLNIFSAPVALM